MACLSPILAQVNPYTAPQWSITEWLTSLVPLSQLASIVQEIMPAFICVGVMLVLIGTMMSVLRSQGGSEVFGSYARAIVLIAAMASCIWWIQLIQDMVNGVVGVIGSQADIQQLTLIDPNTGGISVNMQQTFQKLSQFLIGTNNGLPNTPGGMNVVNMGAWSDYLMRLVMILLITTVAGITTFIIDAMILIQKLILLLSRPFVPVFIGCLALEATKSNAFNFFKQVIGVMCWPVGWALINVGTVAALQSLNQPNWTGDLGALIMALTTLAVVCLWMIVGTIGAPKFMSWALTSGGNFAAGVVGTVSSTGMQMVTDTASAAGRVAGAGVGGMIGGSTGAAIGGQFGAGMAESSPLAGLQSSLQGGTGTPPAVPSARSAAAADAMVQKIVGDHKDVEEASKKNA